MDKEVFIRLKSVKGIYDTLDIIFGALIIDKNSAFYLQKNDIYKAVINRFMALIQDNIFFDEYAVFYDLIVNKKSKIFSHDMLELMLENNKNFILKSNKIDIPSNYNGTVLTEDEKFDLFKVIVLKRYEKLKDLFVSIEEFNTAIEFYRRTFMAIFAIEMVNIMGKIMADGYVERDGNRKRVYKGVEGLKNYFYSKSRYLDYVEHEGNLVVDLGWLKRELDINDDEEQIVLDTGIKEIDEGIGGFRKGSLVTILGPTKGGKTSFTVYLVERALSKGLNVAVWPLEGTYQEWIAKILSCMIRRKYNIIVNSRDILDGKEQNLDLVLSAKAELALAKNRGKLSFISGSAYVEDFIAKIERHYEAENAFDVLVIDQLIDILSKEGKNKVERISEAYIMLKDLISSKLKNKPIALVPAQLKQVVIDQLRKNPDEIIDITAGGESAETIRAADEVIGLFSSREERLQGKTKFYSVASRHSKGFETFYARSDLRCSWFYSDESLNIL